MTTVTTATAAAVVALTAINRLSNRFIWTSRAGCCRSGPRRSRRIDVVAHAELDEVALLRRRDLREELLRNRRVTSSASGHVCEPDHRERVSALARHRELE